MLHYKSFFFKQTEVVIHTECSVFHILNKHPCSASSRDTEGASSEGPAVLVSLTLGPAQILVSQRLEHTVKHLLTDLSWIDFCIKKSLLHHSWSENKFKI